VSIAEYARREGFDTDAAYRWRQVLRRTGRPGARGAILRPILRGASPTIIFRMCVMFLQRLSLHIRRETIQ